MKSGEECPDTLPRQALPLWVSGGGDGPEQRGPSSRVFTAVLAVGHSTRPRVCERGTG